MSGSLANAGSLRFDLLSLANLDLNWPSMGGERDVQSGFGDMQSFACAQSCGLCCRARNTACRRHEIRTGTEQLQCTSSGRIWDRWLSRSVQRIDQSERERGYRGLSGITGITIAIRAPWPRTRSLTGIGGNFLSLKLRNYKHSFTT